MIIFTDELKYVSYIRDKLRQNTLIYNLSSAYSCNNNITDFITMASEINHTSLPMYEFINTQVFDIEYAGLILNNPALFSKLVEIMQASFNDICVIILVYRDSYRDSVMESLIKLIQNRYGYKPWIIDDIEDIECIYEQSMTPYGLLTLDADIKWRNQYERK